MTHISIDGEQIDRFAADLQPYTDDVYDSLQGVPNVDGGIASNMIALIASAGAEASQTVADSYVSLMALARAVATAFGATEESAAGGFAALESEIENS